ncbi:MAG: NUDIX domain-containing protein [Parcubacteria group bacterium]|jgi:ADP-ribose pyrophosphatase YjhB (NUDIX family)
MKKIDGDSLETELKEGAGIMEGVEVAILNKKNQVLLGKRLASAGFGTWNFPGGHLKAKEKIAECAAREVSEELGEDIDVEITDELLSIRENCIAPQYIHHLTILIKGLYKKAIQSLTSRTNVKSGSGSIWTICLPLYFQAWERC